jgi:hypothetical protein
MCREASARPERPRSLPERGHRYSREYREKRFDPFVAPSDARTLKRAGEPQTIRADRAVPELHRATAAAWTKPQVSGPDEFSAPTGSVLHEFAGEGHLMAFDHFEDIGTALNSAVTQP